MKSVRILLFAFLALGVNAYDVYGAYERLFFYYAYRIDHDLQNNIIAPGCNAGRPSPCSFNEFIEYITPGSAKLKEKHPESPDVDQTAKWLTDHGWTGEYNLARIMPTGPRDVGDLLLAVSEKLNTLQQMKLVNRDSGSVRLAGARDAIIRVATLRSKAQLEKMEEMLTIDNPGITIQKKTQQLWSETTPKKTQKDLNWPEVSEFQVLDIAATDRANPNMRPSPSEQCLSYQKNLETSHTNNIDKAKQASLNVRGCSKGRK